MAGARGPTCRHCSGVSRAHEGRLIDYCKLILRGVWTDHCAGSGRLGPSVLLLLAHPFDIELWCSSVSRLLRSLAHLVAIGAYR